MGSQPLLAVMFEQFGEIRSERKCLNYLPKSSTLITFLFANDNNVHSGTDDINILSKIVYQ